MRSVGDAEFALCLTHDVDRPYKTYQAVYDAVKERSPGRLWPLVTDQNPYWQFRDIMALEDELGVKSAFYFLNERHILGTSPRHWLSPTDWIQHLGRYEVTSDEIAAVIRELAAGGWEIGLHGSFHSADDRERLRAEKSAIESVFGRRVRGGRQHYLRMQGEDTWRHHRAIGLDYDTSLGSGTAYGFRHGYGLKRPFGDDFVVFPLTVMDQTLPDPGTAFEAAWAECERLLEEAAENDAVMTVLWHPRLFNSEEFSGYRQLYRGLVETALEMGAWVGTPEALYDQLVPDARSERPALVDDGRPTATAGVSAAEAAAGGD